MDASLKSRRRGWADVRPAPFLVALSIVMLAGCTGLPTLTTETSTAPNMRLGVVIFNEAFRATQAQPASFAVEVPVGAQHLQYEISQDSGLVPNLHVSLTGCGDATLPGSASTQNGTLCAAPLSGPQTLKVEVSNLAVGTGRILLRADLPA